MSTEGLSGEELARTYNHYDGTVLLDPHGAYAMMREHCPVARTETFGGHYLFLRYDEVWQAYHDSDVLSSYPINIPPGLGQSQRLIPLEIDQPEHADYRRIVDPLFAPKRIAHLEDRMRGHAVELIDAMVAEGEFDFIRAFATPYPSAVFIELMGLPSADRDQFDVWKDQIMHASGASEDTDSARDAVRASAGMGVYGYFYGIIGARRAEPRDDIITSLLASRYDGERDLTQEEVLNFCFLLFIAGLDTVTSTLGFSMLHLARRPDLRKRLADDPGLIPTAVEELVRYDSIVEPCRTAVTAYRAGGVDLQVGDRLSMILAAANRDPRVFDRPDELVLDRYPNRHIGFGAGKHRCLGNHLARLEMRVAFEEIFARMPDFSVPEDAEIPCYGGGVKGMASMPMRAP
jgi:cytochrome P450